MLKNEAEAQFQLGVMYMSGNSYIKRHDPTARKHLLKANENGHKDALYMIGESYRLRSFWSVKSAEAKKYYQLASNKGHAGASLMLAKMYKHEGFLGSNDAQIAYYFGKALRHGSTVALDEFTKWYKGRPFWRSKLENSPEAVKSRYERDSAFVQKINQRLESGKLSFNSACRFIDWCETRPSWAGEIEKEKIFNLYTFAAGKGHLQAQNWLKNNFS